MHPAYFGLRALEEDGMSGVPVMWVDTRWNTRGEGDLLHCSDAEGRRCGEQTELETPVVRTVNDAH